LAPPIRDRLQEQLDDFLEDCGIHVVLDELAFALSDDQACGSQDRKMPRNRRPAALERVGDFAGRPPPRPQQSQDAAAGGIGKRTEGAVDRHRRGQELADLLINVKRPSGAVTVVLQSRHHEPATALWRGRGRCMVSVWPAIAIHC
jgi:hypothetical protein